MCVGSFKSHDSASRDKTNGLTSLSTDSMAKGVRPEFIPRPGRGLNPVPSDWQSEILPTYDNLTQNSCSLRGTLCSEKSSSPSTSKKPFKRELDKSYVQDKPFQKKDSSHKLSTANHRLNKQFEQFTIWANAFFSFFPSLQSKQPGFGHIVLK